MKYQLFSLIVLFGLIFFGRLWYVTQTQSFTLVVVPDTQKYTMYNPEIFSPQMEWIANNTSSLNLKFVTHVGDIVQSGASESAEWQTASAAPSVLEKANVPFGMIPGNHDVDKVDDTSTQFTKYNEVFPLERFNTKPWFGGNYREYQDNYQLITVKDIDFIIVNVEVDPSDEVLNWADQVLSNHQERKAIFTTHSYLQDDTGQRTQTPHFRDNGNSGEAMWQKLIKRHCNVFLVLSGHSHSKDGENRLESTNECGQTVHQVIQDYQDRDNGGDGWLRMYRFYPKQHTIKVETYSPWLQRYERDENSEFVLSLPF